MYPRVSYVNFTIEFFFFLGLSDITLENAAFDQI